MRSDLKKSGKKKGGKLLQSQVPKLLDLHLTLQEIQEIKFDKIEPEKFKEYQKDNLKWEIIEDENGKYIGYSIEKTKKEKLGYQQFKDQSYYQGEFFEGNFHGNGIRQFPNKTIYKGEWNQGNMEGFGELEDKENNIFYEGQFKENKKEGFGVLSGISETGTKERIYAGQWENDQIAKFGIKFSLKKGKTLASAYYGHFTQGYKDKYGIYTLITEANEDKKINKMSYIGNWNKEKFEGKGKLFYHNGDIFDGKFDQGKRQGHGEYQWKNQRLYIGNWAQDVENGQGIMIFSDQDKSQLQVYKGQFDKGKFQGKGEALFKNTLDYYIGDWINGLQEGKGYFLENKENISIYQGMFQQGKQQGLGIQTIINEKDKNKIRYDGNWSNGLKDGIGELQTYTYEPSTYNTQEIIQFKEKTCGTWQKGELVKFIKYQK